MSSQTISGFGDALRAARRAAGISQGALAERAGLGIRTVQRLETGATRPYPATARLLAAALDVPEAARLPALVATPRAARGVTARGRAPGALAVAEPLIGRDVDLAAVCDLVRRREVRLVTLTGTAGIGKTSLAHHVADALRNHFSGNVWFVPLALLSDPRDVLESVAVTIGRPSRHDAGRRVTVARAATHFAGREVLLVLDNLEHLLHATAEAPPSAPRGLAADLAALLAAAPTLTVLATSRQPVRLRCEQVYPLAPLGVPGERVERIDGIGASPAVALFVERARRVLPSFSLTNDNARAVAALCRRLDGLPLAIELAAARSGFLSPAALLGQMVNASGALDLLQNGPVDAPERHQTLRQAISWSYDLLSPAERALLCHLAAYSGGAPLDAVKSTWRAVVAGVGSPDAAGADAGGGDGSAVIGLLASLVEKSLVQSDQSAPESRFALLQTIREFALEQIRRDGAMGSNARDRALDAHAAYFLALAERAAPELHGANQARWLARLARDRDNLHAALAWFGLNGWGEPAMRLAGALTWFWARHGHTRESRAWVARTLTAPGTAARTPHRVAAIDAAALAIFRNDPEAADALWAEGIAIALDLGDLARAAWMTVWRAWIAARARTRAANGRLDVADRLATDALHLARASGDAYVIAACLFRSGCIADLRDDTGSARAYFQEALGISLVSGDMADAALLHYRLARLCLRLGDRPGARDAASAALCAAQAAGVRRNVPGIVSFIARLALLDGDQPAASRCAFLLLEYAEDEPDTITLVDTLGAAGAAYHGAGNPERASAVYARTLAAAILLPDPGEVLQPLPRTTMRTPGLALALEGTAALSATRCEAHTPALWLIGAADALRRRTAQPLLPEERCRLDQQLAPIHARHTPSQVASLVAEGARMTMQRAITVAREESASTAVPAAAEHIK
jgi:predicted ATPase/DNA-binding XRE family transcriptional regulator